MAKLLIFTLVILQLLSLLTYNTDGAIRNNRVNRKTINQHHGNYSFRDETKGSHKRNVPPTCNLPVELVDEIKSYQTIATEIIKEATEGSFQGRTYNQLAKFVDKYGSRLSGSQSLEDSIDYMINKMKNEDKLDLAYGEDAIVPHWVRGEEEAQMLTPRHKNLAILGLGRSVGTTPEGITAEVLVVRSFEELEEKADQAVGKIVVYNQPYISYGASQPYRTRGATEASKAGAVAALIRSIAPFSLDTPHTGGQNYGEGVKHIPSACITIEDAELLDRLQAQGENITIKLRMMDFNLPFTTSRNAIGELTGTEFPLKKVIVSGHIDSWDVGQGAMDDGGGCLISTEAVALLKFMGLKPKRSVQAILWTAEELGLYGGEDYARHHAADMENIIAAFESDGGTFNPTGFDVAGTDEFGCIMYEILKLSEETISATEYAMHESVSTDISHLIEKGVPGISLMNEADEYFYYHHTEADTMSMMDAGELDRGMGLWAMAAYVIADLKEDLPRRPVAKKES